MPHLTTRDNLYSVNPLTEGNSSTLLLYFTNFSFIVLLPLHVAMKIEGFIFLTYFIKDMELL